MRLRSVLAVGVRSGRRWREAMKGVPVRWAQSLLRARLRVESIASDWRGSSRRPRIMATACGQFPIYSQTFVYQEVCALVEHGFALRFSYSTLEDRRSLDSRFSRLWGLKRPLLVFSRSRSDDLRYYQQKMPEKVESVTRDICEASGLSRDALVAHDHYLQAFSFTRMVEAWRPDYLHSYFFYERTFFTLVASRLLGIPRGVSCYADHMLNDYPLKLVALNVATCDVGVATSQRIKRELESICGRGLPHVVVKPNGIDTRAFTTGSRPDISPGEPAYLVSVCRLEPKKGLCHLIDAVGLLRDQGVKVELHLLGAPDDHDPSSLACATALKAQVLQQGLSNIVCFEGRQAGPEVRRHLARAEIFVAPFVELENGDKDGISTAVLEAMASGCAIVATDAGSTTEAIDAGQTGLIVPQRDTGSLANAIQTLISDRQLREQLGRNAVEMASRQFDVAHCEDVFHQHIRRALAGRAS